MSAFLTAIGTILTSVVTWLGTATTAMLGNEIFQIVFAVVVFMLFAGFVIGLAKSIKGGKRRKK